MQCWENSRRGRRSTFFPTTCEFKVRGRRELSLAIQVRQLSRQCILHRLRYWKARENGIFLSWPFPSFEVRSSKGICSNILAGWLGTAVELSKQGIVLLLYFHVPTKAVGKFAYICIWISCRGHLKCAPHE